MERRLYILKLFRQGHSFSAIEHEARVSRLVGQAGLPSPAVEEIVKIHGRYGIIYERISGHTMLRTLATRPWVLSQYARCLAALQVDIHQTEALAGLPSQHQQLRDKIQAANRLSSELRAIVLQMLDTLPAGKQLCHGDFHPDNVLITSKGPVIIDWIDVTNGTPLADVARSSLLMTKAPLPVHPTIRWLLAMERRLFHRVYLRRYFQLCPQDGAFERWLIVNAAARLSEGIPEEQALLALVQSKLTQEFAG